MVSLVCAVVWSTWAMIRTTPVVLGSEKTARALPPRVVVWEGSRTALLAHTGSSSNVTGTPSTARPWASCTRTITSATCGIGSSSLMISPLPPSVWMCLATMTVSPGGNRGHRIARAGLSGSTMGAPASSPASKLCWSVALPGKTLWVRGLSTATSTARPRAYRCRARRRSAGTRSAYSVAPLWRAPRPPAGRARGR
jgi:hypothetical protein